MTEAGEPLTYAAAWQVPGFFTWLIEQGNIALQEAFGKLNMGIGFVQIFPDVATADHAILIAQNRFGLRARIIGRIVEGERGVEFI